MAQTTTQTQSTTSETSDADSRPAQLAAAATGNAPSSRSLPPQTLPCYPVYKPLNMRGLSRSDPQFKPRPLSYHWLIGLCARHIHIKPSGVERYVERLELLHIVPRNPHDNHEKMMRCNLSRRCFKPIGGRSKRRRSKLLVPIPAKNLI